MGFWKLGKAGGPGSTKCWLVLIGTEVLSLTVLVLVMSEKRGSNVEMLRPELYGAVSRCSLAVLIDMSQVIADKFTCIVLFEHFSAHKSSFGDAVSGQVCTDDLEWDLLLFDAEVDARRMLAGQLIPALFHGIPKTTNLFRTLRCVPGNALLAKLLLRWALLSCTLASRYPIAAIEVERAYFHGQSFPLRRAQPSVEPAGTLSILP